MPELKAGDDFPKGVTFTYVPWTEDKSQLTTCGQPITYNASEEFANKKVVLVAIPGAFTGTCTETHLPGFVKGLANFRKKGADLVICIAANDAYVMSAYGKALGIKNDDMFFMCDTDQAFSKSLGWLKGTDRLARYAMVIDNGKVTYAEKEPGREVSVSSADAVIAQI